MRCEKNLWRLFLALQGSAVPPGGLAPHGAEQRQHHLAHHPAQWPRGPQGAGRLRLHAPRQTHMDLIATQLPTNRCETDARTHGRMDGLTV